MSLAIPTGCRIAYFGGSFDPPHNGHLAVARAACRALTLDRVLFAPVGLQPLKPDGPSASFDDRVAMTRLAIADDPCFQISLADAPNPAHQPNYTMDTLARLRTTLSPETQLFLILGADAFRKLPRWHRADEIPFTASLIIVSRPNEDLRDLDACIPPVLACELWASSDNLVEYRLSNPSGGQAPLYLLPNLHYDISATQLRDQIQSEPTHASSLSTPALIPAEVLSYIRLHGLYRE